MLSVVENSPVLVLNADYRPLSYFPLSLWSWQDTVKAVFLDRVNVLSEYEHKVRSPSFEMRLPSVIALKEFVLQSGNQLPKVVKMYPRNTPRAPTSFELQERGRMFPPNHLHESWRDFLYWDTELENHRDPDGVGDI